MARTAAQRRADSYRKLGNLRKMFREFGKRDNELTREVKEAVEAAAIDLKTTMIQQASGLRDTGAMIDSIAYTIGKDGLTAYVGPGARGTLTVRNRGLSEFDTRSATDAKGRSVNFATRTKKDRFQLMKAYWHEYGTKKMKASPFIGPTRDIAGERAMRRVEQAVAKAFVKMRNKYK